MWRNNDSVEVIGVGLIANLVQHSIYSGVEQIGIRSHVGLIELLRKVDKLCDGGCIFDPLTPIVLAQVLSAIPEDSRNEVSLIKAFIHRLIRCVRLISSGREVSKELLEETEAYLGRLADRCIVEASMAEKAHM